MFTQPFSLHSSEVMESYSQINKDSLSAEQREFLDSIQPKEGMFENLDKLKDASILMVGGDVFVAMVMWLVSELPEKD